MVDKIAVVLALLAAVATVGIGSNTFDEYSFRLQARGMQGYFYIALIFGFASWSFLMASRIEPAIEAKKFEVRDILRKVALHRIIGIGLAALGLLALFVVRKSLGD